MSSKYLTTSSESIYYFDYGAHTHKLGFQSDLDALCASTLAYGGHCYAVRSTAAAYLDGYRAAFTAVSEAGPRLGLLNIAPQLTAQPFAADGAASPVQSALREGEEREARLAWVNPSGRVYGVLRELPAEARPALLELVGRAGSMNCFAELPCTVAVPVDTTVDAPAPVTVPALVCAALDMDVLVCRYMVPDELRAAWQPLPPLASTAAERARDARTCGSGRWPYMHWCNCITSNRLAPSADYLASLREALTNSPLTHALPATAPTVDALLAVFYGLAPDPAAPVETRDTASSEEEGRTWYMAYGSNLSWEQVCVRIGPPYQRRPVKLPGYELIANKTPYSGQYASFGYYNIEPCEERRRKEAAGLTAGRPPTTMPPYVCGAAYEISRAQLALMDGYETGYVRECLPCEDLTEDPQQRLSSIACWAYLAEGTAEDVLPSKEYLQRVLEGADILPAEYIAGIRSTPTNPKRSPRQDRRLRKEL